MNGKNAFIALAIATALGVLDLTSAEAGSDRRPRGGFVMRCSLVGVNPVHHPKIFGDSAAARDYGFVRSRDGGWTVRDNCLRSHGY